jgi:hypothetical protein
MNPTLASAKWARAGDENATTQEVKNMFLRLVLIDLSVKNSYSISQKIVFVQNLKRVELFSYPN